jgi:hypothetical protein
MPLNEIPKYLTPEVRSLIEAKLSKDGTIEAVPARNKLRSTMVALASVGETDHRKLKWFSPSMLGQEIETAIEHAVQEGSHATQYARRATQHSCTKCRRARSRMAHHN